MSVFTRNERPAGQPIPETGTVSDRPAATASVLSDAKPRQVPTQPTQAAPVSSSPPVQVAGISVISKALKITGQLESTEDIQVDGEVEGDVRGLTVIVGSNAKINGTVYGDKVELSGTIEGKIEAKRVVLHSTARMSGDVIHQDIKIESGAFIDGHCRPEYGQPEKKKSGAAFSSDTNVKSLVSAS